MTKSQMIQALADQYPNLHHRDLERVVNVIFDELTAALVRGERIELRGFGAFSVRNRDARQGRNPRTGDPVHVPPKRVPFFKAGRVLLNRMN